MLMNTREEANRKSKNSNSLGVKRQEQFLIKVSFQGSNFKAAFTGK